jgi:serine/threonine protein kinase
LKRLVDEFETANRSKNFQFKLGVDVKTKSHRALFQTFGKTIYEAEWIKDNDSRPRIVLLKIDGARAKKEASFYVDLSRHPNIVRTFGLVHSGDNDDDEDTQNSVTLLQELAPEGSLYEVLQHISLNENILQAIFLQIVDAMVFLAHNGIIHGDLACRNVLVFRLDKQEPHKNIVKLTDFGISRHSKLYAPTNTVATTMINIVPTRYAAPEVLANEQYSEKSDVYSMGVLMWEAYSQGKIPWSNINSDDEVKRQVTQGEKLQKPKNCSPQMWSVIESCFILRAEDRPPFTTLKHNLLSVIYQLKTSTVRKIFFK